MGGSLGQTTDRLATHFIVICLFLALFILTWIGVGNIVIVSMLGFLLCIVGLAQGQAQVDLWVLVPLMLYNLLSMASSYAEYGNVTDGYASTQMIYPAIYLVLSYADEGQRRMLHRLCALWAAVTAAAGLGEFIYEAAIRGGAWRLGGLPGNPNAMGIFLVTGWFVLSGCREDQEQDRLSGFLACTEPFLLAVLALTLSMGSFLAMAAGTAVLIYDLTANPLLGVGPYRWRFLDMYDGGTYYNTWHIHNVLLHVGVELGLAAMIMLAAVAVRFLCKKKDPAVKAGFAAFFLHNMMDTGFFYLGITAMVLLAVGNPRSGGKTVRAGIMRVLFGGLAVFFTYNLYYYITA